ncbi:hypothetical protein [Mycolicibacterium wolinskyi]|uniref:Uncharacterized protein n=3 Tax=Mycolicibacterium TaxID=1866885 RepID=A0A1X2F528_9MYCO|nr:hypothetical protein [Mycolicibacterium wolinskyi]MCV7292983.1 hypothetical protein [Mycolicibacterium goodii]ORX13488.1 hypothetical protein AWC31_30035 [Mycolicibacterium wolinskyi]
MDDDHDAMAAVREVAWWVADIAVWISISFSAMAHLCLRFADRNQPSRTEHGLLDMTSSRDGFAMQVGQGFGYVAVGWIVVSAGLAIMCRVRYGIAKQTTVYLVLLVLAIIACGTLPAG